LRYVHPIAIFSNADNQQSENSITSVTFSPDGTLLVVATVSDVKAYQIIEDKEGNELIKLTLEEVEGPTSSYLERAGARSVQVSLDGKWLLIVTVEGVVLMADIAIETNTMTSTTIGKAHRLRRLTRQPNSEPLAALRGYDRRIIRTAISPDSKTVAVGDLAGFVDIWKLGDREPETVDTSMDSDDSDSESSSDESDASQVWTRIQSNFPKLKTAPLILSFRPTSNKSSNDDRIVVLTSDHTLYEFQISSGRLSEWSKRNPSELLPKEFRNIMDRAMGSFWDVASKHARLWLYGSTWMFMVDLSRDLPVKSNEANPEESKKRKRDELNWGVSGAGGAVNDQPLALGIGKTIKKTLSDQHGEEIISTLMELPINEEDDLEDDSALADFRRPNHPTGKENDGVEDDRKKISTKQSHKRASKKSVKKSTWATFNYRWIMGVVPIGELPAGTKGPIEMALVERPWEEFDLPSPWVSVHEKAK
jgi:U3 small nucleolar RNA-associated protein 4